MLLTEIKKDIENDISKIVKKIDTDFLVKYIFVTLEEVFSYSYNDNKNFSKEALAEEFSYLFFLIFQQQKKKIKLKQLINYDYISNQSKYIEKIKELEYLLEVRHQISNMLIYIMDQNYTFLSKNNILKIEHPIDSYEYYYKLGYLRNVLDSVSINYASIEQRKLGIHDFIELSEKMGDFKPIDFEIRDNGFFSEAIIFRFDPIKIATFTKFITNSYESRMNQVYNKYLMNSQVNMMDKCTKKSNIRWFDLVNFSIVLELLARYIDQIIEKHSSSYRMLINTKMSIAMSNERLSQFFHQIFMVINRDITIDDVKNFLGRFTTNITSIDDKRFDLQFRPIVKIENLNFILFNVFSVTEIARAYIGNNNIQMDDQGKKFENEILNLMKTAFPDVHISESVKYNDNYDQKGEIDIILISEKNIYFIECKNRILPISAVTSTTQYEYMKKAIEQLTQAEKYFNHDRLTFINNHIKKPIANVNEYTVHKIVFFSNSNLSGLNYENIAIRDITSLSLLAHEGKIVMHETYGDKKTSHEISLYENGNTLQEVDFLNYISKESIFFKNINHGVEKRPYLIQYKDYKIEDYMLGFDFMKYEI